MTFPSLPRGIALAVLWSLLLAPPVLAQPAKPGALPDIGGSWSGGYVCGQGATGLRLSIIQSGGMLSAVFAFGPIASNPAVPAGAFRMQGRMAADGTWQLEPAGWLQQPEGYEPVSLSGRLAGEVLEGRVNHPSCAGFTLTR